MKKFRDETDEKKIELFNALENDSLSVYGGEEDVFYRAEYIVPHGIYKVIKRPMSIDWSVLKDEYICAAMDKNGESWAYTTGPKIYLGGYFCCAEGKLCFLNGLKSYDPGTVDWKDSLIWRPGYSPDKKENNNG